MRHLVFDDFSDDCLDNGCQSSSEIVSALRRPNWERFLDTDFSVLQVIHTHKCLLIWQKNRNRLYFAKQTSNNVQITQLITVLNSASLIYQSNKCYRKLDAGHSIECKLTPATRSPSICFLHFVNSDLWPWSLTFCRNITGWPGLMMHFLCGK